MMKNFFLSLCLVFIFAVLAISPLAAKEVCGRYFYGDYEGDGIPNYVTYQQYDQTVPAEWRQTLPAFSGSDTDLDEVFESAYTVSWEGSMATRFYDYNNNGVVDPGFAQDSLYYYDTQPMGLLNPEDRETYVLESDRWADGVIDEVFVSEHDVENFLITRTTDNNNDGSIDRVEVRELDPEHPGYYSRVRIDIGNNGSWDSITTYVWNETNDGYTEYEDNNGDGSMGVGDDTIVIELNEQGKILQRVLDEDSDGIIEKRTTYEREGLVQRGYSDDGDDGTVDLITELHFLEEDPSLMDFSASYDPVTGMELDRYSNEYEFCPTLCGNDSVEGDEVCDGSDLGGETCQSQGFVSGELACQTSCEAFDVSNCQSQGEVLVEETDQTQNQDKVPEPSASQAKGSSCALSALSVLPNTGFSFFLACFVWSLVLVVRLFNF
ncbi:MAG: hypothetical protein KDK66_05650 [Deltaproteobacteria bacterium]|nr:hypothetical protein [Deltaproteobacteria bacterium]